MSGGKIQQLLAEREKGTGFENVSDIPCELTLFVYHAITVSYARELTSVSMYYSQGNGVNTSLSRLMYCTHK